MKCWHVWDFPDNIRVRFRDKFKKALYKKLIEICKTRVEIARRLKSNKETIRRCLYLGYRKHKDGKKVKAYISIPLIKRIITTYETQLGKNFIKRFDKNIVAYRSWNGWDVINPILPIKETPKLYSIAFHLIGDGNASVRHSPFYSNKCEKLINKFIQELQIFGKVETKIKIRENGVILVYFPKAIADILSHTLKVKFVHPDSLPASIFNATMRCKISAIRALFDDEGSVSHAFSVSQKSKNILRQLKKLLKSFNIKTGKICQETGAHKLYVSSRSYEKYLKLIGFNHPEKKNLLKKLVNKRKYKKSKTIKYRVLKLLNEKCPLNKYDISSLLGIHPNSAWEALRSLKKEGKVVGIPTGKNKPYLWYSKV
jgi:hypothetical protein